LTFYGNALLILTYKFYVISGEKVEVTGMVDRTRSVELHLIPVVHLLDLAPGHNQAAGHVRVQRVDLVLDLSPRADLSLDHSLDPDQKVVHALAVDPDPGQDQIVTLGQDQEVGHVPGVGQDRGRVYHDPDLGQRVGQGVVDHHVLGLGNYVFT
jgi:hypothetical protein